VDRLVERLPAFGPEDLLAVVECLATPTGRSTMGDGLVDIVSDLLTDMLSVGSQADFSAGFRRRMRDALDRYHPGGFVDIIAQLD
jgi:hypothetical protein